MVPPVASQPAELSAYILALQKRASLNLEFKYGGEHILSAKLILNNGHDCLTRTVSARGNW
jgi:hypothetical protein